MASQELIELAKKRLNCSTYRIAKLIEANEQNIYSARKGKRSLTEEQLFRLCDLVNEDPARWLPGLLAERSKSPQTRAVMEKVAKLASTSFALFIAVSSAMHSPTAEASDGADKQDSIYYVKLRELLARLFNLPVLRHFVTSPYAGTFCAYAIAAIIPGSQPHNV